MENKYLEKIAREYSDTETRVKRVMSDTFKDVTPDQIKNWHRFGDDLKLRGSEAELVMNLESEFGKEIPDHMHGKLPTVGSVIKFFHTNEK